MRLAAEFNCTIVNDVLGSVGGSSMPRRISLNKKLAASAFIQFCVHKRPKQMTTSKETTASGPGPGQASFSN
jgi:hypothetical protein